MAVLHDSNWDFISRRKGFLNDSLSIILLNGLDIDCAVRLEGPSGGDNLVPLNELPHFLSGHLLSWVLRRG